MDSVFSFTDLPIRILVRVGGGTAVLAGMLGFVVVIGKLMGFISIPGYAMTMLTIIFLGAINLFGLGVVGSYAWRIYENTKGRPHTIAMCLHQYHKSNAPTSP